MDTSFRLLLANVQANRLKVYIEGSVPELSAKNNAWLEKAKTIVAEMRPHVYGVQGIERIDGEPREHCFEAKLVKRQIDHLYMLEKLRVH